MRLRPESYHQALRDHEVALSTPAPGGGEDAAPASIHERFMVKEPGLANRLHYDPYERRSGLVRFLPLGTDPQTWANGTAVDLGDAVDGGYGIDAIDTDRLVATRDVAVANVGGRPDGPAAIVRVTKTIAVGGSRRSPTLSLTVEVANRSAARVEAILGLEWTMTMLGGGGNPAAWWEVDGERTGHDVAGTATGVTDLAQGNDHVGISVATSVSAPADAWWAPVETISNSEAGFERVYQGSGLLLSWPLSLDGGASMTINVSHAVTTARDRADEERERALSASPTAG